MRIKTFRSELDHKNKRMKTTNLIRVCMILFFMPFIVVAQQQVIKSNLSDIEDNSNWTVVNRDITFDGEVYMTANPGNGLVLLKGSEFTNGTIELDIKGKDVQSQSFVGIAFHGLDDQTYDAIYFRPFNFENPDRNSHSVQYISMPDNDWSKLRTEFPDKYENTVTPVPDPDEWFHATIKVNSPDVEVFINNSETPSLSVQQISSRKTGWIGFWTGNNSDGYFKNLEIRTDSDNN